MAALELRQKSLLLVAVSKAKLMKRRREVFLIAKRLLSYAFAGACLVGAPPAAAADDSARRPWTLNFIWENDSPFNMSDRHYTSGVYISATSGPRERCETCSALAGLMLPSGPALNYRYGFFLGESIFTPVDLLLVVPDPTDRPYAGWLYTGVRLYRESDDVLDRIEATIGIVGPDSGAEAAQRWFHALHGYGHINGWDSQLKDEPGLILSEQRTWRRPLRMGGLESELLPEVNVSLGNISTYAGAGAAFRIGRNLRRDWGPPRVEPAVRGSDFIDYDAARPYAWYGFVGIEGRAIARNIFLDGNSFQRSANVAKEPLVADLNAGFAILWRAYGFYATYTERTKEFKAQKNMDHVFSFTISLAH